MTTTLSDAAAPRRVYCLCAEWCGVCRQWRAQFEALAAALPQAVFVWVDVDAHEEVLDLIEIETFPVLLIAQGDEPLFCGPIQPAEPVLRRLLEGLDRPAAGLHPQARRLLALLAAA